MKKVYGYPGKTEAIIDIPAGKAMVRCNFKNGRYGVTDEAPATLVTENPIVMAAIEHDPRFLVGQIVLLKTYFSEVEKEAFAEQNVKVASNGAVKKVQEFPGIDTFEAVVSKLKELGAPATSLRSKLRAREAAENLNVAFPDFKFD